MITSIGQVSSSVQVHILTVGFYADSKKRYYTRYYIKLCRSNVSECQRQHKFLKVKLTVA